jgi:hypothetical protein
VHCLSRFVGDFQGCVGEISFDQLVGSTSSDLPSCLLDRVALLCLATLEATSVSRALLPGAHTQPPRTAARCGRNMAKADINAITAICDHSRDLHRRLAETHTKWVGQWCWLWCWVFLGVK